MKNKLYTNNDAAEYIYRETGRNRAIAEKELRSDGVVDFINIVHLRYDMIDILVAMNIEQGRRYRVEYYQAGDPDFKSLNR